MPFTTLARFLSGCFLLILTLSSLPLLAGPIDQEGWNARKQRVSLRNGMTLACVEMGDPRGEPLLLRSQRSSPTSPSRPSHASPASSHA